MEMLLVASVWYLLLTSVASVLQALMERRFDMDAPGRGEGWAARMFAFRGTRDEPARPEVTA